MNKSIDFQEKLSHIERLLHKKEYTDSATRCVIVIEQTLRHMVSQCIEHVDEETKRRVQDAVKKRDRRGEGITSLTMGQIVHVVRESKFFDAWAHTVGKDLSSLQIIDLDQLTKLRNKFAHYGQEASHTEAEFLLHCLKVMLETFDIVDFGEIHSILSSSKER